MRDLSVDEQLEAIDRALGIRTDLQMIQSFRDAGFNDVDAERGARIMESTQSQALGFEHVALELATNRFPEGTIPPSAVRREQIAEAARAVEERAADRNRERTSPWGRKPVKETGQRTPWGRESKMREPSAKDFTDVGLSIREAAEAHDGLKAGRFISFEDACLSVARSTGSTSLREDAMRTRARRFIAVSGD
jgi:hypothetical protein